EGGRGQVAGAGVCGVGRHVIPRTAGLLDGSVSAGSRRPAGFRTSTDLRPESDRFAVAYECKHGCTCTPQSSEARAKCRPRTSLLLKRAPCAAFLPRITIAPPRTISQIGRELQVHRISRPNPPGRPAPSPAGRPFPPAEPLRPHDLHRDTDRGIPITVWIITSALISSNKRRLLCLPTQAPLQTRMHVHAILAAAPRSTRSPGERRRRNA